MSYITKMELLNGFNKKYCHTRGGTVSAHDVILLFSFFPESVQAPVPAK